MSHIEVDENRCKGCELCTTACPYNLVVMADHFSAKGYRPATQVDPEGKCTGCALCARICPDIAIAVYRTVKE